MAKGTAKCQNIKLSGRRVAAFLLCMVTYMYVLSIYLFRIDLNFVIKVADFGLSESLDITKDYFRQDQETNIKLPVKWMAPESMNDGVFSEKTDAVRVTTN